MPRVLFVDHTAKLGGAELSLLAVAEAFRETSRVVLFEDGPFHSRLRQKGVDVTVLPAVTALEGIHRDGSVTSALWAVPGLMRLAWRLSRLAREYDVLLANSQKSMLVASVAGLMARRPVLWYLRDLMTPEHFGATQRWAAATAAHLFVSRVIANSHATAEGLVASGGPSGRIAVVHNGIDGRPFRTVTDAEVAAVRRELDLPASGVVGVFSRLAEWKGQHILLEALRSLPDVTALLVGEALFPEDEQYADRLRADVERWGLSDRVCMPGFRSDIPVLMRACDAILHTSTSSEPFGRVIVEGMLAGRPVIATREGGPAEIIEDGTTGLLVPAGDPAALQAALERVLGDQATATALGRRGEQQARSSFSTGQMISGVRAVVESVVSRST